MKKENEEEEIPQKEEDVLLEDIDASFLDDDDEGDEEDYPYPFLELDEFEDPTNENVYRIVCSTCEGHDAECETCDGTGLVPGERFGGLDIDESMLDENE